VIKPEHLFIWNPRRRALFTDGC